MKCRNCFKKKTIIYIYIYTYVQRYLIRIGIHLCKNKHEQTNCLETATAIADFCEYHCGKAKNSFDTPEMCFPPKNPMHSKVQHPLFDCGKPSKNPQVSKVCPHISRLRTRKSTSHVRLPCPSHWIWSNMVKSTSMK